MFDPRVESKAHHICHVVGENEGIVLSDKSRYDIFSTVRDAVDYWKGLYDRSNKKNYEGKYKEVAIFLRKYPHATGKDIQQFMLQLDMNGVENCRNIILK